MQESTSAIGCAICTPTKPRNLGKMTMSGRNIIPLRKSDIIAAINRFPQLWKSILAFNTNDCVNKEIHCTRMAKNPNSTTS